MRNRTGFLLLLMLGLVVFVGRTPRAHPEDEAEKTLSPYFFVKSDDPELDRLPLKSTSARVNISGVIADVTVSQVYKNEGKRPLEAIYVFPASTRAAVYGMKMTIGERTIVARIRKREAARREYEAAKQAGKSASLLEQHRPNVFQMNVANILPSDVVTVELRYTELLVPRDGIYEFVYPTVVGPRYSNRPVAEAGPRQKWIENPYLHEGEPPSYAFDIAVNLAAGLPIRDIVSPSHEVDVHYDGPAVASITLDGSEKRGGNRDFVLGYRLAGGRIETGLLLYEGEEENFFLLMLQPPKRVRNTQIPPREYIFIVDVSGSMHGFPLRLSKKLIKDLIAGLRPFDRFNVLLFAGGSSLMSERSLPASPENVRRAIDLVEHQRGGGGTELLPALKRALCLPKAEGYSRTLVIATDGYVTVEEEAFDLIRNNLGHANMFAFGIGSSVNRHLIEGMARVGMGEPFVITKPEEAPEKAERFRKMIASPVLTGIEVDFGLFQVYDVEPPSVPDVMADRPITVFGKWRGRPQGRIRLRGIAGDRPFVSELDVAGTSALETNAGLRYLWVRHRIAVLADYNRLTPSDERIREITHLGLSYNLLTAYTSFVAIDSRIRVEDGHVVTIKQPLPLPQGVSDYAVGKGLMAQKVRAPVVGAGSMVEQEARIEGRSWKGKKKDLVPEEQPTPPMAKAVRIELKRITVMGDLSQASIRRTVEKQIDAINRCYREAFESGSKSGGEVVATLLVTAEGRVSKVKIDQHRPGNRLVEPCIVERLKKLNFEVPQSGKGGIVTIVFLVK